jgi:hypothetical protein
LRFSVSFTALVEIMNRGVWKIFGEIDIAGAWLRLSWGWFPFFSLKGWHNIAQGNALGLMVV